MNAKKLERWVLLEQTGELSPRQVRRLNRMLNQSEASRKIRDDLLLFSRSVQKSDEPLSPWVVTRINSRLRGQLRPDTFLSGVWRPALAMAACIALVAGILNFRDGNLPSGALATAGVDVWNVQYDDDLGQLESLILAISDDSFDIMEM